MQGFNSQMHKLFLFNTLKENSKNGLTLYDLQQYGNIPSSIIYRKMKKLEEDGFLRKEEKKTDHGRPKYIYFLTEKGIDELSNTKTRLSEVFQFINQRMNIGDLNVNEFISNTTFKIWAGPVEHLLQSMEGNEEKLQGLNEMEKDFEKILNKIKREKRILQQKLEKDDKK